MLNRLNKKKEKKNSSKGSKKSIEENIENSSLENETMNEQNHADDHEKYESDEYQRIYGKEKNSESIQNENLYSNSEVIDINEENINSLDENNSRDDSPYYCSNSSSTFDERRIMNGNRFSNISTLQTLLFDSIVQSSDLQVKDINLFDPSNVLESANELDPINKTIIFDSIKMLLKRLKMNKVC